MNDELSPREKAIEALKLVEDPELFMDVWFLGLIYNLTIEGSQIDIEMTFTSPMCPMGPQLIEDVKKKVGEAGFNPVNVKIVFSPPWQPSDEVRAMLGLL